MGSTLNQNLHDTYGNVNLHEKIGNLIRRYSSNKTNIYSQALENLSISKPINVLDIGCGFGQFSGVLCRNIYPNSSMTGIDLLDSNQLPFLKQVDHPKVDSHFINSSADIIKDLNDNSYDLVLSGFSLYFFIELLPEITRILKPDGTFIAITHSSLSLTELLDDILYAMDSSILLSPTDLELDLTLTKFNAENGVEILSSYFKIIESMEYENELIFHQPHFEDCIKYVDFKLKTISHNSKYHQRFEESDFIKRLLDSIQNKINSNGKYTLTKNDAIFQCRKPITQGSLS